MTPIVRIAFGVLGRDAQSDRSAPVVDQERHVTQVERFDERLERCLMAGQAVVPVVRSPRQAHAHVVRNDHAEPVRELAHDLAPHEAPRRVAVHAQKHRRIAWAFVDVVQELAVHLEEVGREGPELAQTGRAAGGIGVRVLERRGGAQDLDGVLFRT